MGKKWSINYLLIGTALIVLVSIISTLAFVNPNLKKSAEKHVFDSMYQDTSIDFIVPSPSNEQISEEESNPKNGIKTLTPFFLTNLSYEVGSKKISSDIILFPNADKINKTPYCSKRIIDGNAELSSGDAVVDQSFANRYGVSIGDKVSLAIINLKLDFTITSISEDNLLFDKGSIAIVLRSTDTQTLISEGATYSAAYVEAENYNTCANYLMNEYKPYGRLKPASAFSSDDTYNQHYENFMNADWSKEITNFSSNYDSLKVKYANYDSSIQMNRIIAAVLIGLTLFIYQLISLGNSGLKKFIKIYLVKKNGLVSKVSNFFVNGVVYMTCLYVVVVAGMYILNIGSIGSAKFFSGIWNVLIPVLAAVAMAVLMVLISAITVKTRYSSKKIQAWKELERKKQEELKRMQSQSTQDKLNDSVMTNGKLS